MNLLPWVISREILNDGKLGSSAKIYTYESSTNTPKATYKKADGSELNTNPIICDASGGFVCFLGSGAYRILVTDENDIQIAPPVDGIVSDSSSINSTATTASVKTYNELRSLTTAPDYVYVAGRSAPGDGGEGLFQLIPNSTTIDDDAIVLTAQAGSVVYKRVNVSVINPQWRGLVYNVSIDQKLILDALCSLSVSYGLPVQFTDAVFINQNITIPAGAQFDCTDNGYFNSTLSVTMSFAVDSKFTSTGRAFGITVRPIFQGQNVDNIKLSWMAGTTDDDRLLKLLNSSTLSTQVLEIDQSPSIASSSYSTSATIKFTNNARLIISKSGALSLSFPRVLNTNDYIFEILDFSTTITSFNFGNSCAYPEWFGAVCNGVVDDSFAFWYSTLGGHTFVTVGKIYHLMIVTSPPAYPTNYKISGEGTIKIGGTKTLGSGSLQLNGVTVTLDSPHIWFNGSYLEAINSSIPSTFTATTKLIDGCMYSDDVVGRFPVSDGKPGLYNAHLPLIISAGCLATDGQGKIYDCSVRPSLIPGSTYSYVVNDIAWSSGLYGVSLKIAPISDKIAHIAAHIIFNPTGNTTPWPSQDFAYIEFDSADNQIKSWLIAPFYSGQIDKCFREDYVTVYDTAVPSIIAKEGRRFVFGDTKGLGGNPHSGTMVTPNPYMGWGNIWPRMSYSTAFVTHEIAWSGLLIKP